MSLPGLNAIVIRRGKHKMEIRRSSSPERPSPAQRWPDDAEVRTGSKLTTQIGDEFYVAVLRLEALGDAERAVATQAVRLIRQLDRPFHGLLRISSEPMVNVPCQFGWG